MARSTILAMAVLAGALADAAPAVAQFGNIFDPPRPPSDVPGRQPVRPPPPPPAQTLPPPQARENPPGGPLPGPIQAQPLPPPPGTEPTQRQSAFPTTPPSQPPLSGQPPG